MKKILLSLTLISTATPAAADLQSVVQQLGGKPYQTASVNNDAIFQKYCTGAANSTAIPQPKYDNTLVAKAARRLSQAKKDAFYFYGGVKKMYGLSGLQSAPQGAPQGTSVEAHILLVQLCGEYRDRASMIEAKLKWYNNLFVLPVSKQGPIDPKGNVWKQVSAYSYEPFLHLTESLWEARRASKPRYITVGNKTTVDYPVDGITVCETKYVFSEYIGKDRSFDSLEAYEAGYKVYSALCPKADLTDYYDFRGDSNIKHYSPEANAMIWQATTTARACASMTQRQHETFSDKDCENYFKRPFAYRYNAARSGLATWLFPNAQHRSTFNSSKSMFAIVPHRVPELAPMGYSLNNSTSAIYDFDSRWLAIPGVWSRSDLGFNQYNNLNSSTGTPDYFSAYDMIRAAVDRHTDWYASGYNDGNDTPKSQAYSPFVASSYVMGESDQFTFCGITVPCQADGHKRWMFVFRVKADNWYNPLKIIQGYEIDFEKMWFDETSFGDTGLANSEKAWDRLGTPMEEEFDSILYLYNIEDESQGSGEVITDPSNIIQPIQD